MDEIKIINKADIVVAANEKQEELRTIAVNSMKKEVATFLNECMKQAKEAGFTTMLSIGKEFKVNNFFKKVGGYDFPEELQKEIEGAGYRFIHFNGEKNGTYKVWG